MRQCNDGQGKANTLQNRFTAYLLTAVRRQKYAYSKRQVCIQDNETLVDCPADKTSDEEVFDAVMERFPPTAQLDDAVLMQVISNLTPQERYILFGRILNKCGYEELGRPLGLQYKGVAAAYRRIIQRLRKELGGEHGF